jgi:hypothetical protein
MEIIKKAAPVAEKRQPSRAKPVVEAKPKPVVVAKPKPIKLAAVEVPVVVEKIPL